MNIDKDLIGKPPNVAHVINDELTAHSQDACNNTETAYSREQLEEDMYELVNRLLYDSQEQLEADLREWVEIATYKSFTEKRMLEVMHHWLDRQATITERAFWEAYANGNLWETHQYEHRCEELTAECDLLKCVKDRLKRENEDLKARNHELEATVGQMDALLVQKQRVIDIQRESFKKLEYEITVLKKKGAM